MSYNVNDTRDDLSDRPTPAPRRSLEPGYRPTPLPRSSRSWRTISEVHEDMTSVNAAIIREEQISEELRLERALSKAQQELDTAKERHSAECLKTRMLSERPGCSRFIY